MISRTTLEFRVSGYIVLTGFEAVSRVRALHDEVIIAVREAMARRTPDADSHPFFDVWVAGVDKVSDLAFELSRSERVVGLAEDLLGGPVVPLRSCYAASKPRPRPLSPWHVDGDRYAAHFGNLPALAICFPLSDVGPQAGGLEFLRNAGIKETNDKGRTHPRLDSVVRSSAAGAAARAVTARVGDAIAYHSYVPYRLDINNTDQDAEFAVFAYRFSPYRHRFGSTLSHGVRETTFRSA